MKKLILMMVLVFFISGASASYIYGDIYLDENGTEHVSCSRADGLAFDVLRKLNKPVYILSTETNLVVKSRAKKLKVPVLQGICDKVEALKELSSVKGYDLKNILYVGNDLNDYHVMQACGYSACPKDSHKMIKSIATVILKTRGGNGVVRDLLEDTLQIDFIKVLYSK